MSKKRDRRAEAKKRKAKAFLEIAALNDEEGRNNKKLRIENEEENSQKEKKPL